MLAQELEPIEREILVKAAIMAPSMHDCQPWQFRFRQHTVEVHRDPDRELVVDDPDGRMTMISCGAAVFNIRVAAASLGRDTTVDVASDPDPTLVAEIAVEQVAADLEDPAALFPYLSRRRTNRRPAAGREVSEKVRQHLAQAATREGAVLEWVEDAARTRWLMALATPPELVRSGAAARRRAELQPAERQSSGGEPADESAADRATGEPDDRVQRDRGLGDRVQGDRGPGDRVQGDRGPGDRVQGDRGQGDRGQGDRGQGDRGPVTEADVAAARADLSAPPRPDIPAPRPETVIEAVGGDAEAATVDGPPTLAVLWTAHDDRAAWVGVGQALQRVLLVASTYGLTASMLNQTFEHEDMRWLVRERRTGWSEPQVVLRFGYGPEAPSVPRRPATAFVLA